MESRGQFTFYRSFWDAVRTLPKKDRLPVLEAIISYALDGTEPAGLSQGQLAFFLLVKPNLDSARKKAASGKQGGKTQKGNGKQSESKPEANASTPQAPDKHPASKKEGEKEKEKEKEEEIEIEIEGEKEKEKEHAAPSVPDLPAESGARSSFDSQSFSRFWEEYPEGPCKTDREGAWKAWRTLCPSRDTAAKIMTSLAAWKRCRRWTDDGGAFVPTAANFLTKGYWKTTPTPAGNAASNYGKPRVHDAAELEAIQRVLREVD